MRCEGMNVAFLAEELMLCYWCTFTRLFYTVHIS